VTAANGVWGDNVRSRRKQLALTQRQLARACGVTQQTISSIETGEQMPRDRLKVRLAEALEQDVTELFPLTRAAR
jgi:putative transcriptional regulator